MTGLPVTYTTAEVAGALKVTPTAVRRLVADGKVRPMRLSDSGKAPMRFTQADVDALVASLRPAPAAGNERKRRRRRAA
jgi:excisionase family DNA binding protein